MQTRAFQGVGRYGGTTQSISATTSSARISSNIGSQTYIVSILNAGSADAFLAYGGSGVTATTSGEPIKAGERLDRVVDPGSRVAAITASGSTTIYVSELTS